MQSTLLLLSLSWSTPCAEPPLDWDKLTGEWVFVERSVHGESTSAKELANLRLVIAKDRSFLIYQDDRSVVQGAFVKSNPSEAGNAIDRNIAGRSEFSGKFEPVYRQKGLIRWDKDRLTMIFAREPSDSRPKEFDPKETKGLVREVLKRK